MPTWGTISVLATYLVWQSAPTVHAVVCFNWCVNDEQEHLQVSLWNFVKYNVVGGGQSALYGVEVHACHALQRQTAPRACDFPTTCDVQRQTHLIVSI